MGAGYDEEPRYSMLLHRHVAGHCASLGVCLHKRPRGYRAHSCDVHLVFVLHQPAPCDVRRGGCDGRFRLRRRSVAKRAALHSRPSACGEPQRWGPLRMGDDTVIFSVFDGIAAARQGWSLRGLPLYGLIPVEKDPVGRPMVLAKRPSIEYVKLVQSVDAAMLQQLKRKFHRMARAVINGGFTSQDSSSLHYPGLGLKGSQIGLFWELARIVKLVRQEWRDTYDPEGVLSVEELRAKARADFVEQGRAQLAA